MTGAALAVRSNIRTSRAALYFLAPALIVLALLLAYPVIYSIWCCQRVRYPSYWTFPEIL